MVPYLIYDHLLDTKKDSFALKSHTKVRNDAVIICLPRNAFRTCLYRHQKKQASYKFWYVFCISTKSFFPKRTYGIAFQENCAA